MKVLFLVAVIEDHLSLYKFFFRAMLQYEDRSDTDKVYVSKKCATIPGWSAQSKLLIFLDATCNDPRVIACSV